MNDIEQSAITRHVLSLKMNAPRVTKIIVPHSVIALNKAEKQILKLLKGWTVESIECLLIHRVIPEAKKRSKLPGRLTQKPSSSGSWD